jgi:hypothetical protein
MDGSGADRPQVRLAVVEVLDRDGHARQVVAVWRWPLTIGRAIDCDVVLDDPFIAAHHATLEEAEGAIALHVGDSVNGAQIPHRRLKAGERAALSAGDVVQLGATRLRVRGAADPLAPERELAREPPQSRIALIAFVIALCLWGAAERWITTDPGGRIIDYLPVVIGPVLALAVWCSVWALGSRLFRHHFDYARHARIASSYWLLSGATATALPIVAYALGWAFPSRIADIASAGVLWAMLLAHLTAVLPARRRGMTIAMAALFAAGVALFLTRNYQVNDRFFGELYVSTLAPPVLRVSSPVAPARFIDEARGLKAVLDRHVKDDASTEEGSSEDE